MSEIGKIVWRPPKKKTTRQLKAEHSKVVQFKRANRKFRKLLGIPDSTEHPYRWDPADKHGGGVALKRIGAAQVYVVNLNKDC